MNSKVLEKLQHYKPNNSVADTVSQTKILLLVGPTGAGKDSVKEELLKTGKYHHIVSHTTRRPRINHGELEQDGEHYHFIDIETAEKMLDAHEFIEAKIYSDNLYGTSVQEIQTAHLEHKIAMTDLEVQGVAEYKDIDTAVLAVFLLPPSFELWQARLMKRYGDVVDVVDYRKRLETARKELETLLNADYYIPIINDDLQETCQRIDAIAYSKSQIAQDTRKAFKTARELVQDIDKYLAAS